jgi:hypothetical protein
MKHIQLLKTNRAVSAFFTLIIMSFLPGCAYYYKVQTESPVISGDLMKQISMEKYFILHQGAYAWHLSEPHCSHDQFTGILLDLPANHLKYQTTDAHSANRYKNTGTNKESTVLNEVHIYLTSDTLFSAINANYNIRIALSAIQRIEIYSKAKGRTTASWVIPAILPICIPLIIIIIFGISGGGGVSMGM